MNVDKKFKSKEYKDLKSKNYRLFSFSELSTINECPMQYYYQYIEKIKGRDNVYSFMGNIIHELIEGFYDKTISKEDMLKQYKIEFNNCQYSFDKDNIKDNYFTSVIDYIDRLKPLENIKFEQEKLVYFPLNSVNSEFNNFAFHGFIDLLLFHKDGSVSIIDYKTSTKYTGQDRIKKSYQLILYAIALEYLGYTIKYLAWDFLKTCKIEYKSGTKKHNKTIKRTEIPQYFGFSEIKISHDIFKIELTDEFKQEVLNWIYISLKKCKDIRELTFEEIPFKEGETYFCKSLCSFPFICKKNT